MIWIDHDGKPVPRHATFRDMVYVRFRDGTETRQADPVSYFCGAGNNWKWGAPADPENEIVAYKVMRAYIINWFTAEPYEDYSGVHKIFDSREKAEEYLANVGSGPHGVNDDEFDPGYFLSIRIEEYDVE